MGIPTKGEEFAKLIEYLRLAAESAAMLAHLANNDGAKGRRMAIGWLGVEQTLKLTVKAVTDMATKGLQ
jgi:aromatic ring-cleaving dioxygenase